MLFKKETFSSIDQNILFQVIIHEFIHVLGLSNSNYRTRLRILDKVTCK